MSRKQVFAEVAAERERQDQLFGGAAHDDRHSASDWVGILVRHLGLAMDDGKPADVCFMNDHCAGHDPERFRRQMVRVAAVAVAVVESFDRKKAEVDPLTPLRRIAQDIANEQKEPVLLVVNPPAKSEKSSEAKPSLPYCTFEQHATKDELAAVGSEKFVPGGGDK